MEETCKKCKGKPPRRGQPKCSVCYGAGRVVVKRDKDGLIVSVVPAVKS